MDRETIIKLAIEAKLPHYWPSGDEIVYIERVTHFAKLVAQHEREKFCAVLRQLHDSYSLASDSNDIRARGNT